MAPTTLCWTLNLIEASSTLADDQPEVARQLPGVAVGAEVGAEVGVVEMVTSSFWPLAQ